MKELSQLKKGNLEVYGNMLADIGDKDIVIRILEQINKSLSYHFSIAEDISESTYKYYEDFLSEIILSLTHNEFEVAFIQINRLFYHHPPVNITKKWWELGDYSSFV